MSIDREVLKLKFRASEPEIHELEQDIAWAIEGCHIAEVLMALMRTTANVLAETEPDKRAELLRRFHLALAERLKVKL